MKKSSQRKEAAKGEEFEEDPIDTDDIPELDFSNPNLRVVGRGIYAPQPPRFSLPTLRDCLHLTQAEVADRAGMSQSEISRLERREDCLLSTLDRYVTALGGTLRIAVCFNGGTYELEDKAEASNGSKQRIGGG